MKSQIETEHKYIIKMPSLEALSEMAGYYSDDIVQIYIPSEIGATHRIRSRRGRGRVIYTETEKIRIDKMSSVENEREIGESEFIALSKTMLEGTRPVVKTRHTFEYRAQIFEVDVYPEWDKFAIMEAEVQDARVTFDIPDAIEVVREVTGDGRYSNASISRFGLPTLGINE